MSIFSKPQVALSGFRVQGLCWRSDLINCVSESYTEQSVGPVIRDRSLIKRNGGGGGKLSFVIH